MVARDRDEAEALERELEVRRSLGAGREAAAARARRGGLEPALAPAIRLALEVPDDHAIDPAPLTEALAAAARAAGAELLTGTEVAELVCDGRPGARRWSCADGVSLDAEQVVIAAGAWTTELAGIPDDDAGRRSIRSRASSCDCTIRGARGCSTRVLRIAGTYLVPRGDGRYVLGATMEERGYDTTVTAGAVFELLRDAAELVPGITELVIDELIAGLRPATPDGAAGDRRGGLRGLHWAVGHFRNGILLAPVTAEIVVAGAPLGEPIPERRGAVCAGPLRAGRRWRPEWR